MRSTEEKIKRKVISVVIIVAILSTVAGCGKSQSRKEPITLTIWHVYGGQTDSPLNDLIDEFNGTEGKKEGIKIQVGMVSNTNTIHEEVLKAANKDPGAAKLPDLVKADNKDLSKSEQSLQNLQKNLRRSRMPMAAAYLGYADDNSPFRDQVRTLLKNGKYEEQYSFLADVPKENYISYNGEEVYAIVPQSTQYAMKVESFDWDENANAMVRDTLYISQKAAPVILKCNLSELSYNVVITLTKGTETFSYSPSLSLMDGALYAYNLDGMEIYDFTLYDNLEIPVWNEGGECGGCGDPEGYGAPLEAAGEEPGLIGQWISTELKNQSGQNITYGMYFGDYQYFEFQYGQMGHDLECWSGTFEVTDQFRNGELVVHYVLYTPDGIREGEFYTMVNYGEMLVTEGSGDAIFPFTDASTEWFYSY